MEIDLINYQVSICIMSLEAIHIRGSCTASCPGVMDVVGPTGPVFTQDLATCHTGLPTRPPSIFFARRSFRQWPQIPPKTRPTSKDKATKKRNIVRPTSESDLKSFSVASNRNTFLRFIPMRDNAFGVSNPSKRNDSLCLWMYSNREPAMKLD